MNRSNASKCRADPTLVGTPLTDATAAQLREIAHELRNPLNALTAIAEVMKDERFGPLGDAKYREYAALAHEATERMLTLCDRLVVAPTTFQEPNPGAVTDTLADVVELYRPMAETRGVSLELDISDDLPDVSVDTEAFSVVMNNLITNAIKFTPEGGRVSVLARCELVENVAVFIISDTGIGMDAEELSRQMRPTAAAVGETVGVHGDLGSGLGLTLVNRTLKRMGGTLELKSRKGVGTCAVVRLPLGPPLGPT